MANCRWLSRGAVLDSATRNINAIYDLSVEVAAKKSGRKDDDDDDDEDGGDVGDGGDASAKRLGPKDIVERLGDFKYVASIFFLSDLIGLVNTVTTTFQQDIMESAVVTVKRQVGRLLSHISNNYMQEKKRWAPKTKKFLSEIKGDLAGMDARGSSATCSSVPETTCGFYPNNPNNPEKTGIIRQKTAESSG